LASHRSSPPRAPASDAEQRVLDGAAFATRFFMREADVHRTLDKITRLLDQDGIAYALVGALALNEHGYRRTTVDVNLLMTADGLAAFKAAHLGRGYRRSPPAVAACAISKRA
jgi:hypothetical protein